MSHLRKSIGIPRIPRGQLKCTDIINLDLKSSATQALIHIGHKILQLDGKYEVRAYVACYNALVLFSKRICTATISGKPEEKNLLKASLLLVRCGLWSEVKEVRCAALRCIRYLLHCKEDVILLLRLHLDYFIGRSVDLSVEESSRVTFRHMDENERVQVLRCVWHLCRLAPDAILKSAPSLLRAILDELLLLGANSGTGSGLAAPVALSVQQGQAQQLHLVLDAGQHSTAAAAHLMHPKDQTIHAMVLLLCQLVVVCPQECVGLGIDRALLSALLHNLSDACSPDHARRLCEAITLTLVKTLDTSWGRLCLPRGQIEKLLTPFTRLSFDQMLAAKKSPNSAHRNHSEYGIDQLKIAKFAIVLTLRTWSGLLYFCQPESDAIMSLNQLVHVGHTETRREILDLLFDLFLLPKPPCLYKMSLSNMAGGPSQPSHTRTPYQDEESHHPGHPGITFDSILHQMTHYAAYVSTDEEERNPLRGSSCSATSSSRPGHFSASVRHSKWSLAQGFLVMEALALLPYRSETRPDLVENHLALLLSLFIERDLLEALVAAVSDSDEGLAVAATVLLGHLIYLSTTLLPNEHPSAQRADTMCLLGDSRLHLAVQRIERLHKAMQSDCHRCFSPFLHYLCVQSSNNTIAATAASNAAANATPNAGGTISRAFGSILNPSVSTVSSMAYTSPGSIVRSPSNFAPLVGESEPIVNTTPHASRKSFKNLELLLEQLIQESGILHSVTISVPPAVLAGAGGGNLATNTGSISAISHSSVSTTGTSQHLVIPTGSNRSNASFSISPGGTPASNINTLLLGVNPLSWDWDLIVCFVKRLTAPSGGLQVSWEENAQMSRLLHTLMDFFTSPAPYTGNQSSTLYLPRTIQVTDLSMDTALFPPSTLSASNVANSFTYNAAPGSTVSNNTNKLRTTTSAASGVNVLVNTPPPSSSFSSSSKYNLPPATAPGQQTVFFAPVFCQQKPDWVATQRAAHTLIELMQHLVTFPLQSEAGRVCREFLARFYECLAVLVVESGEWQRPTSSRNDSDPLTTTSSEGDVSFHNMNGLTESGNNLNSTLTATLPLPLSAGYNDTNQYASFSSDSLQRFSNLQYLFLAVGRLTSSEKGEELLEQSGITQAWRDIFQSGTEDTLNIVKLVLSSLDYTRRGQARAFLRTATTSACEEIRVYAAQYLRILHRARLPFYSSWCVDLLVNLLHDCAPRVVAHALDALQEACEDDVNVCQLQPHMTTVAHLGYPGMLVFTRIMANEMHFNKLRDMNVLNFLMDSWMQGYGEEYVREIECALLSCYSSHCPKDLVSTLVEGNQRHASTANTNQAWNNNNVEPPSSHLVTPTPVARSTLKICRSSTQSGATGCNGDTGGDTARQSVALSDAPTEEGNSTLTAMTSSSTTSLPDNNGGSVHGGNTDMNLVWWIATMMSNTSSGGRPSLMLPPHPFGALSQHREGMQWLRKRQDFEKCVEDIQSPNVWETHPQKCKAALWNLGHLCSTTQGLDWAEERKVVPLLYRVATSCPLLSIRGTAVFCLSLVASTPKGVEQLHALKWYASRTTRFSKWALIMDRSATPNTMGLIEETGGFSDADCDHSFHDGHAPLFHLSGSEQRNSSPYSSYSSTPGDTLTMEEADALKRLNKLLDGVDSSQSEECAISVDSQPTRERPINASSKQLSGSMAFSSSPSGVPRTRHESISPGSSTKLSNIVDISQPSGNSSTSSHVRSLGRKWATLHVPAGVQGQGMQSASSTGALAGQLVVPLSPQDVRGYAELNRLNNMLWERQISMDDRTRVAAGRSYNNLYSSSSLGRKVSTYTSAVFPVSVTRYRGLAVPLSMSMLGRHLYSPELDEEDTLIPSNQTIPCATSLLLVDGDLPTSCTATNEDQEVTSNGIDVERNENVNGIYWSSGVHFSTNEMSNDVGTLSLEAMEKAVFVYHTQETCIWQKCPGSATATAAEVTERRYMVIHAVQQLLLGRNSRKMEETLLSVRDSQPTTLEDACLVSEVACRLHHFKCCSRNTRTFIHEIFYGMRPKALYEDARDVLNTLLP